MRKKEKGCVYFFRHLTTEPVKIGYSESVTPKKRFEQFKTYAPFGAELLGFIRSYKPLLLERELHKKYADKRLKGEWFKITEADIKKDIEIYSELEDKILKSNYEIKYMNHLDSIAPKNGLNINKDLISFLDKLDFNKLKINRKDLKINFLNQYPLNKNEFTSQKFNRQFKKYAEYNGFGFVEKKINGLVCFVSKSKNDELANIEKPIFKKIPVTPPMFIGVNGGLVKK